ncbi:hypothetical protein [Cellulomonas sp. ES6]|uniref:RipA family octameric membrane protein n=1 Tax=Cellulomonas sp. ES6 TaxID=3039384 RepID=UPI0024B78F2A|nr:hypothetical protein [Cellulomonas sp. ES6]WHP18935.1 hypothetical protein P9841_07415 [Cellulomonas sp. ES6]
MTSDGHASCSNDTSEVEIALDHAWQWFALHAAQRMQLLNYFLLSAGFITAGYGATLNSSRPHVAGAVAAGGCILAVLFWRLDVRTRELIRVAERPLEDLEEKISRASGISGLDMVVLMKTPANRVSSYTSIIRALAAVAFILFAFGAAYGFSR